MKKIYEFMFIKILKKIKINYKKSIFILFLSFLFLLPQISLADSRVHGKAWWGEDLDYLYFDCNDYHLASFLDEAENFNDFPYPRGFHFDVETCAIDQHVNIDDNGNFYGSAFNFIKGLVNFGGLSTPVAVPDYSFNANCLNDCNALNNCSACYNSNDQKVYGWAQVESSGELIQLDSYISSSENAMQIKSWNMSSPTDPFYSDLLAGVFMGHASSTIGEGRDALSFNCISEDGEDDDNIECEVRDYRVYIENPQVGRMTAPNWSFEDACNPGKAKGASLRWDLSSGLNEAFEIVVMKADTAFSTSSLENTICWSDVVEGSVKQYNIPNSNDEICISYSDLEYGTQYNWYLRLRYNNGTEDEWTNWYQFGVNDGHLGEIFDEDNTYYSLDDSDSKTFATYLHEFPVPYFTWSPEEVLLDSENPTIFNALDPSQKSYIYNSSSPNNPIYCDETMSCAYNWSTSDMGAVIGDNTNSTTSINFYSTGDTNVDLVVTDNEGYSCTRRSLIENINYGLPVWREVKAE